VKAPSPAPLYATILPVLVEHARALGYALAVHGTLARDLDLVAVPWVDGAAPAEDLVRSLAQQIAWTQDNLGYLVQGPEKKPHGRLAWTIPLVGDAFVDLSVCNGSGMRPPPKADAAVTTCVYPPGFERDLSVPCTRCGLTADIEAIANGLPPTPCSAAPEKENTMDFGEALRALKEDATEGRKYDSGKDDYSLIPPKALAGLVRVLTFGARKYARDNWRFVPDRRTRYFSAAMRHMWAWFRGEKNDPETGENHLHHAACCISFLADEDEDKQ